MTRPGGERIGKARRGVARAGFLACATLPLSACSLTATTHTTTYDLPPATLAKASAVIGDEPFCPPAGSPTGPVCAPEAAFETDMVAIAHPDAYGEIDMCTSYDLVDGGTIERARCLAPSGEPARYQARVDCFAAERRIPGQPLFAAPSGWRGGICTAIVEETDTGTAIATLPLGYDRLDDTRPLTAHASPDGNWLVVIDTKGVARSFRMEDL